jgi:AGCS family alanine or glycine:cation symporter
MPLWLAQTLGAAFHDRSVRKTGDAKSISQFQALTAALAACMGTGNIVGVATAVFSGGPGAVFWMLLSAFLGMMTCCAENILGIKYRYKNNRGEWIGGAMVYIKNGLGMKKTAGAFSILLVLASFGIGNMTQANSIAGALEDSFGVSPLFTGILAAALTGLVIVGGIRRIAGVAEKIIPFISAVFIIASFIILLINIRNIPSVISTIFKEAFSFKSAAGGVAGIGIARAARYGVARGVFSNEAGLGSTAIIHAAADVREPVIQGMWGIVEVFIDTVVMCTVTALVILSSGVFVPGGNLNGVSLSAAAYESVFGQAGRYFVCISIVLFAFATLIGWSYYGENGVEFLFGLKSVPVYKAFYLAAVILGCTANLQTVWSVSDTLNGLMAVPNLFCIVLLSGQVRREIKGYLARRI